MTMISTAPLTTTFGGCHTVQTPDGTTMAGGNFSVAAAGKMYVSDAGSGIGPCMTCKITDTDTPLFGGIRAEITLAADSGSGEYWYYWEQFIPESFGTGAVFTTMQIHDTADEGEPAKFPNFLFATDGVEVFCYIPNNAPVEQLGGKIIGKLPLIKGRWTPCLLHVRWDAASATKVGFMEVVYDGVILAKRFLELNHYPDVIGPYLKIGLYDAFDKPSFGQREAYFRNVQKWDATTTFFDVLGGDPSARLSSTV